jgi:alkylation response protein AidB-like acyl-CoA dehydrogenase
MASRLLKGLEEIEAARESLRGSSFLAGLYAGRPDFSLIASCEATPAEEAAGEAYCRTLTAFLTKQVDPDEIERTAKIPEHVIRGLFALGAFGMKIPKEYGGLGLSYTGYGRALTLIAGWSNILALTVAVPQSIGIAMPILLFGTEEQKKAYLPLVAQEHLSAFALTEPMTGSDAANIATEAILSGTGDAFSVNGEKLWCTNGSIARFITLIARVPARAVQQDGHPVWIPVPGGEGADRHVHTAFILDMTTPGVKVRQRCQFEGCRGIENAHITLENVRIPVDNVVGEIGKGLKYALTILNVGRAISIPAICLGMAKQAWQPTLDRANTRRTFQRPLADRQTQQMRIGRMAADLFAMESLAHLVWRMAENKRFDIRIEAAIAKIFCSEQTIRFLKDAQTIFGGMGYETAESKRRRGEPAFGIEQLVRDAEMYRIGEGATDILRPFVAREALNPHLERGRRYVQEGSGTGGRAVELLKLLLFYLPGYAGLWVGRPLLPLPSFRHPRVRPKLRFVQRASRRLARAILYAMALRRERLRDDQGRQGRIEAVGEDLLIITATALSAERLERTDRRAGVWELADEVYRTARQRVARNIRELIRNQDEALAVVGRSAFAGKYPWLSHGIIARGLEEYRGSSGPPDRARKNAR